MSSVHSQTSDVEEAVVQRTKSEGQVQNGSRNGSDTSVVSVKDTITFEKQKVFPRTRTMSVQSVLSSISLRSILNREQGSQAGAQNNGEEGDNGVGSNFINATQQIQSPAMASTMMRKRTGTSRKQSLFSDLTAGENVTEIGQQLPFTDDKRMSTRDLARSRSFHQVRKQSTKRSNSDSEINEKGETGESVDVGGEFSSDGSSQGSESEEDDISKQNKLTTDALRKLSMLQQNRSSTIKSMQTTPLTSSENLIDPKEPLTQLKFGGKNVILDTTRKNSEILIDDDENERVRKQSLDIISQPKDHVVHSPNNFQLKCTRSGSTNSSSSKKLLRQINEPKKPMYLPAVLRDISETNLTPENVKSQSPTSSATSQTTIQAVLSRRSNTSISNYARSVHSTSSSFVSSYRHKMQSWLRKDREPQPEVTQPTRSHWVPDTQRHSCKYCHKVFTFWERKHHCRHCGDIFCQQHVRHWLYLNPKAKFIIGSGGVGVLSKICDSCLEEYDALVRVGPVKDQQQPHQREATQDDLMCSDVDRTSNLISTATTQFDLPKNSAQRNIDDTLAGDAGVNNKQHLEAMVGSVPADWSWSSF